jgi:ral guanine nucleotide dissociation stimulator-like 1
VIEKWIDVAHQCRKLKNFSSLTAILNGLLSGCIYRLNTAWSYVNEDYQSILNELKNVFGSCADRKQARAILDKQLDELRLAFPECIEGTAKYADVSKVMNATVGKKNRHKMIRDQQQQQQPSIMIGTVPYLGLYLSDLTYIDSAYPNTLTIENPNDSSNLSEKLINFEKHRKEFEILAQIKLFQSAANAYTTLHSLPRFKAWFDNVRIYNDAESWDLSYQIEPKETTEHKEQPSRIYACQRLRVPIQQFPCQLSYESLVTSKNGSTQSTNLTVDSLPSSPSLTSLDKISTASNSGVFYRHHFPHPLASPTKTSHINHSRSSSASSYLTSSHGSSSQGYASATASPTISTGNVLSNSYETETIIAKVQLAGKDELLYKKVRIRNDERTTSVLKTILEKFCLNPFTYDRYCIEQRLPDRKILILDHCNVFYALARSSDDEEIELIVREKTRQEREQKLHCPLNSGEHN